MGGELPSRRSPPAVGEPLLPVSKSSAKKLIYSPTSCSNCNLYRGTPPLRLLVRGSFFADYCRAPWVRKLSDKINQCRRNTTYWYIYTIRLLFTFCSFKFCTDGTSGGGLWVRHRPLEVKRIPEKRSAGGTPSLVACVFCTFSWAFSPLVCRIGVRRTHHYQVPYALNYI